MIDPRLIKPEDIQPLTDTVTPTPRYVGQGSISGGSVQLGDVYSRGPSDAETMYNSLASIAQSAGSILLAPQQIEAQRRRATQLEKEKLNEADRGLILAYEQAERDAMNAQKNGLSFSYKGEQYNTTDASSFASLRMNMAENMLSGLVTPEGKLSRSEKIGAILQERNKSWDSRAEDLYKEWELRYNEIMADNSLLDPSAKFDIVSKDPTLKRLSRQLTSLGDNPNSKTREIVEGGIGLAMRTLGSEAQRYNTNNQLVGVQSAIGGMMEELSNNPEFGSVLVAGDINNPESLIPVVNALFKGTSSNPRTMEKIGILNAGTPQQAINPDSLVASLIEGNDVEGSLKAIYTIITTDELEQAGINPPVARRIASNFVETESRTNGLLDKLERQIASIRRTNEQNAALIGLMASQKEAIESGDPKNFSFVGRNLKETFDNHLSMASAFGNKSGVTIVDLLDFSARAATNLSSRIFPDADPQNETLRTQLEFNVRDAINEGFYRIDEETSRVLITEKGIAFRESRIEDEFRLAVRAEPEFGGLFLSEMSNVERRSLHDSIIFAKTPSEAINLYKENLLTQLKSTFPELTNKSDEEILAAIGQPTGNNRATTDLNGIVGYRNAQAIRNQVESSVKSIQSEFGDILKGSQVDQKDVPGVAKFRNPAYMHDVNAEADQVSIMYLDNFIKTYINTKEPKTPEEISEAIDSYLRASVDSDTTNEDYLIIRESFVANLKSRMQYNAQIEGIQRHLGFPVPEDQETHVDQRSLSVFLDDRYYNEDGTPNELFAIEYPHYIARATSPTLSDDTRSQLASTLIDLTSRAANPSEGERSRYLLGKTMFLLAYSLAKTEGLSEDPDTITRTFDIPNQESIDLYILKEGYLNFQDKMFSRLQSKTPETNQAIQLIVSGYQDIIELGTLNPNVQSRIVDAATVPARERTARYFPNSSEPISNQTNTIVRNPNEFFDKDGDPLDKADVLKQKVTSWLQVAALKGGSEYIYNDNIRLEEGREGFVIGDLMSDLSLAFLQPFNIHVPVTKFALEGYKLTLEPGGEREIEIKKGDMIPLNEWIRYFNEAVKGEKDRGLFGGWGWNYYDDETTEVMLDVLTIPTQVFGGSVGFTDMIGTMASAVISPSRQPSKEIPQRDFLMMASTFDTVRQNDPMISYSFGYEGERPVKVNRRMAVQGYPNLTLDFMKPPTHENQQGERVPYFYNPNQEAAALVLESRVHTASDPNAYKEQRKRFFIDNSDSDGRNLDMIGTRPIDTDTNITFAEWVAQTERDTGATLNLDLSNGFWHNYGASKTKDLSDGFKLNGVYINPNEPLRIDNSQVITIRRSMKDGELVVYPELIKSIDKSKTFGLLGRPIDAKPPRLPALFHMRIR